MFEFIGRTSRLLVALAIIGPVVFSALPAERAGATIPGADKVVVFKSKRVLVVLKEGEILKTYRVSLGGNPQGHKLKTGDQRTPEGTYILDTRNPNSKYHLSIRISYPSEADIQRAQKMGVTPGGDIMIHGLPNGMAKAEQSYRKSDWTNGCIAVTNNEIEEIWHLVPDGTPIEIRP